MLQRRLAKLSLNRHRRPKAITCWELADATAALDQMRQRLLDTHPDVVRQQRVVADLQKRLAEGDSEIPTTGQPAAFGASTEGARPAIIGDLESEVGAIKRRIDEKAAEEARLRTLVAEHQGRIAAAPIREPQLADLMRDSETGHLLACSTEGRCAAVGESRASADKQQFKV